MVELLVICGLAAIVALCILAYGWLCAQANELEPRRMQDQHTRERSAWLREINQPDAVWEARERKRLNALNGEKR